MSFISCLIPALLKSMKLREKEENKTDASEQNHRICYLDYHITFPIWLINKF